MTLIYICGLNKILGFGLNKIGERRLRKRKAGKEIKKEERLGFDIGERKLREAAIPVHITIEPPFTLHYESKRWTILL